MKSCLAFRVYKRCCVVAAGINVILLFNFINVSHSREAINPNRDVVKELITEFDEINGLLPPNAATAEPCSLDIQKDLPRPNEAQPLYIVPGKSKFWLPNNTGHLVVPHGALIELHCPQLGFANVTSSAHFMPKHTFMLRAQCIEGKHFRWFRGKAGSSNGGEKAEFAQFVCRAAPRYRVERFGQSCGRNGEAQLYRVGFNLTERFIETMQICHDEARVRTLYAQHTLLPANAHFQKFVKRLNFSKAGGFGNLNLNFLYTQKNQRAQAQQLYGEHHAQYFNERSMFLSRGHLVAKSDMIYANQQRTTFNFYNAAPQWQSFNGGQWAAMEDQVRKYVARTGVPLDCYTGTWGTLTLNAASGELREFHLTRDSNNNGVLPAPAVFYRVLVTRAANAVDVAAATKRRGIVLVGVNNPHANIDVINTSYVLCNDIREQVPWLMRWMRNADVKKGYMYACSVNEFVQAVGDLPKQLFNVSELLIGT